MKRASSWTGIRIIAAREIGAAVDSGIAFVFAIAFGLLANSIFMNEFFLAGTVDMGGYFRLLPLLLAFFLPAITMRTWAEERKTRTIETLLTLPIRPAQAVLGKFLAGLAVYALFLATSLPIPVMLVVLGDPEPGTILGGYLALGLFGALFLAFGNFLSALSKDQITAFVTATLFGFALVLLGNEDVVGILDGLVPGVFLGTFLYENVSVMPHYDAISRGALELPALAYFACSSALFLWTSSLALERIRD